MDSSGVAWMAQAVGLFGRANFGYKLAFIFCLVICVQNGSGQKIQKKKNALGGAK